VRLHTSAATHRNTKAWKRCAASTKRGAWWCSFPSNDFGGEEPGSNREIAAFCVNQYAVDFPMFSKILVKRRQAHPPFLRGTGIEPDDPKSVAAIERLLETR
jgi:glutathione peroxidase-family protein